MINGTDMCGAKICVEYITKSMLANFISRCKKANIWKFYSGCISERWWKRKVSWKAANRNRWIMLSVTNTTWSILAWKKLKKKFVSKKFDKHHLNFHGIIFHSFYVAILWSVFFAKFFCIVKLWTVTTFC